MKIKITIVFVLFNLFSVFSQQELIKEIGKQAITIDSLKKVTKTEKENYRIQNENLNNKKDSIKILKLTLSKLEKFKKEKENFDNLIKQKNDSIIILKNQKSELSLKILEERKICEQKKIEEQLLQKPTTTETPIVPAAVSAPASSSPQAITDFTQLYPVVPFGITTQFLPT
jgi:hypothetical protein